MQIAAARLSKLTGPTALVMIASLALILMVGTSIWLTAANIEQDFDAREEQLIGNGIKIEIARVNGGVESQTLWDDAVLHLDNRLDPKWAKQYLTEYLWANGQYNLVYVLDGADRPVYATEDRASIDLTRFEALWAPLANGHGDSPHSVCARSSDSANSPLPTRMIPKSTGNSPGISINPNFMTN
jgi:sensor domain CHASE-containing protein